MTKFLVALRQFRCWKVQLLETNRSYFRCTDYENQTTMFVILILRKWECICETSLSFSLCRQHLRRQFAGFTLAAYYALVD